ncbi:MFS transporter [Salinibacter ruber]|jgi:MFS family permease|uniref:MFS family permease n=1 Tax=Salinibacter ruber TaxID=146919 RepID=A0A9X2ZS71_9BACT|nr:MFS transporter [Salinibacter ruber]MCS3658547.1 MFS family permease [Salinibacter ruber]MCS3951816.1 MFS family permease [Salinibacter ruber]MCS4118172.1 MFS family permease [Salinibacter ruber]MCS4154464.1 MFS family permease [Salinibacter ruber]MCS4172095.1 MFS family permease [Salinibacter ruber]
MPNRTRLSVLLLISTLPVMTGAVLSPVLPDLCSAFGGGQSVETWTRWVLTTPALFTAIGAPLAGALADRTGRRPVLLGSLLLFAGSGSMGALLGSLPAITASRAVLGLAAGGIGTAATTLIVDYYDDAQSRVLGGQAAVMALSAMLYTVLGGLLTDLSWRAPFGIYLIGFAVFWPASALLPEPTPAAEPESSPAAFPFENPEGSEKSIGWRRVGILYGLAFLGLAVFNLIRVELPYALRTMGLQSGFWIAVVLSGGTVTGALASAGYDRVQARMGSRETLAAALGLFATGFGTIAAAGTPTTAVSGVALAGGGMGLLVPSLSDGVGKAAPQEVRGRLMGGLSTLRNMGRFASPLLAAPALVGTGGSAPFIGGALISGVLALGFLTWTAACRLPGALQALARGGSAAQPSSGKDKQHSEPEPVLCRT